MDTANFPSAKITLDICTSALNEAANVEDFYLRVSQCCEKIENLSWSIIIVDNGSQDNTWNEIQRLASLDRRLLGIKLSRNFGFERAILAALKESSSDCSLVMACDLQDEPEKIPLFIEAFRSGFENVYQVVGSRPQMRLTRRILTWLFYRIGKNLSDQKIMENATDFRLMSRRLRSLVLQIQDHSRFNRALVNYFGLPSRALHFPRGKRDRGKTKSTSSYVVGLALDALFSNSMKPLHLIGFFALGISAISLLTLVIFGFLWVMVGVPFGGFGTIVGLQLLLFSFAFLALGIMSQYLKIAVEQLQSRPLYVVQKMTSRD